MRCSDRVLYGKKEMFLWIKTIHVIAIRIKTSPHAASKVLWDPKAIRDRQVLKVSKGISVVPVLRETEGNRGRLARRVFRALPVQGVPEEIQDR